MSIFDNDIQEVLFSEEQLKNRVQEIARQITADYQGKEIMPVSYTHLDVYKRQTRSLSFLFGPLGPQVKT